jgi:hypothetical protein
MTAREAIVVPEEAFRAWCNDARPGSRFVYFTGSGWHFKGKPEACKAALKAYELGLVHLVQRRLTHTDGTFEFIAERRSESSAS